MKEVPKIVLTGGPCGGKTTSLQIIADMLKNEGYTVITGSETATQLLHDNVRPYGDEKSKLETIQFQRKILAEQLVKESTRTEAGEEVKNDKTVILLDRGILDNRAYITFEEFEGILKPYKITVDEIMNMYDAVIHLRSVAVDKPEEYSKATNEERMEDILNAIKTDRDTWKAWEGHKNHIEIVNDCNFKEKMERVKNEVRKILNLPLIHTTSKFLVEDMDFNILKNNILSTTVLESFVGYQTKDKIDLYTKEEVPNKGVFYTHTRIEKDETKVRSIDKEEYETNRERIDKDPLLIHRRLIKEGESIYKLDTYHNGVEIAILEATNRVTPPDFVTSYQDITNDERYNIENLYLHNDRIEETVQKKIR